MADMSGALGGCMSLGSSVGSIVSAYQSANRQIRMTNVQVELERNTQAANRYSIQTEKEGQFEALNIQEKAMKGVGEVHKVTARSKARTAEMKAQITKLVQQVKLSRMRENYSYPVKMSS